MKHLLIFMVLGLFVAITGSGVIGCGGGSSGGTSTTGTTGSVTCTALDPNSTILGRVVQSQTTTGIANITVKFVDSGNTTLTQTVTRSDGCFDANVPVNATRFQLDPSSISSSFLKLYRYNTLWYAATISSCNAPLPTIIPGTTTSLPFGPIALPISTSTPPFPNGCGP